MASKIVESLNKEDIKAVSGYIRKMRNTPPFSIPYFSKSIFEKHNKSNIFLNAVPFIFEINTQKINMTYYATLLAPELWEDLTGLNDALTEKIGVATELKIEDISQYYKEQIKKCAKYARKSAIESVTVIESVRRTEGVGEFMFKYLQGVGCGEGHSESMDFPHSIGGVLARETHSKGIGPIEFLGTEKYSSDCEERIKETIDEWLVRIENQSAA